MSETMLVTGTSGGSYKVGDLHMALGLGLVRNMIIDQHCAERGRFGGNRLGRNIGRKGEFS